jgi:FtsH-binding integral membrane protein
MNESAKLWTQRNPGVVIGCMVASIVLMLVIVCCENARRKAPLNLILLGLFTICEGITLGVVTTAYRVNEVVMAVGLTAAIVIALTIFAFQTKVGISIEDFKDYLTYSCMIFFLKRSISL